MSTESRYVKNANITGDERKALRAVMRKRYEGGGSIRAIAADFGRSFGFVRYMLVESGAKLRGRGGDHSKAGA